MQKTCNGCYRTVGQQVTGKVLTTCDFTATTWKDAEQEGKPISLIVNPLPAARYPLPAKAATVLLFGVGLEMWKLLQDSSKEDKEALLFSFVLFVCFVVQGFYAFAGSGQRAAGSGQRLLPFI